MNTLQLQSVVLASTDQVSSDLANDVAILDLKAGAYFGLTKTGARIWKLLQTPRTVAQIRDCLLQEYNVEPERCETDLLALLHVLVAKGLVEVRAKS
jgi:hypothetical protein